MTELKPRTARADVVPFFPMYRSQKGERLTHPRRLEPADPRNAKGGISKELNMFLWILF